MCLMALIQVCLLYRGYCFLALIICALYGILRGLGNNKVQYVGIGICALIVVLQIAYLIYVYAAGIKGRTDVIRCINEAIAMDIEQNGKIDNEVPYFARYGNNYFYTVVLYYICRIIRILTTHNVDKVLYGLNVIIVDVSIFMSVKILWVLKRNKKACVMLLILFAVCPATYFFVTYFYTNMLSIPFILWAMYYGICAIKDCEHNIRAVVITGISGAFGFCIRATTVIPVIALFIGIWMFVKKMKMKLAYTALILICFVTIIFASDNIVKRHVTNTSNDTNFPFTHWIMMGLKEMGYCNTDDIKYSNSFDTKEDKIQGEWLEIKRRLSDLGIKGYTELSVTKLNEVWGVGTDDFFVYGNHGEKLIAASEYVTGDKNLYVVIMCQIIRGAIVLLALSGAIITLFRRRKKLVYCNYLGLLGAIIFLLIWETNRKYNICFMPLLILAAVDGIGYTSYIVRRKKLVKTGKMVLGTVLSVCILAAIYRSRNIFSISQVEYRDIQIDVGAYSDEYEKLKGEGEYITQSFVPSREFNEIIIGVKNQHKVTAGSYMFELIAPDGSIIHSETWPNESYDAGESNEAVFRFDNVNAIPSNEPYTIKLTNVMKQDNAVFIGHNPLKYYDVYSKGECIKNSENELTDMTFRVAKVY